MRGTLYSLIMNNISPHTNKRIFLLLISCTAAMRGLLFGYDWVVIGGAIPFYEIFFGIESNPVIQGWAVSCALIGCVAGSTFSGVLSGFFGRKQLLIASAVLFLLQFALEDSFLFTKKLLKQAEKPLKRLKKN